MDGGGIRISASGDAVVAGQLKALGVAATGSGTAASDTVASGTVASGGSGKGGRIEITGQRVALTGAALDARGPAGGGTVLLGGDVRGANPAVANANTTTVDGASTVRADALAKGDGGTVVLWSEQQTSFSGTTSARGGPSGGDGGFLEVSSKGGVGYSGAVDAAAPAGKAGSVLFDPKNIIIDSTTNILAVDKLQFGGEAFWDGNRAVLTPSDNDKAGSFFYNTAISLANDASFSTSFQFKISDSNGDQGGADGLVFVVKNSNADAIGGIGGGLGYLGINNSLGIEFDTYNNGVVEKAYKDIDGNHVGINLNGSMESKVATYVATDFNNTLTLVWTAWVDYNDNSRVVDVRLADSNSRPAAPTLSYAFENGMGLKDIIGEVNGSSLASFGFTAATGGAIGKHEILSWSLFVPSSSSSSSNPSGDLFLQPIQIQTIANQGTNVVLQANNDITLMPNSSITIQSPTAGSGGISMQAGRSITLQSPITYVGEYSGPINLIANDTSLLPSFRDIGAGNLTVDTGATLASPHALISLSLGPVNNLYSPGVLQINAPISASTVLARGASGITLSGAAVLTASAPLGRAITLDAGSGAFLNKSSSGATALVKQLGATWAIYADHPTSTPSLNLGGLPYSFKQYNQTFETNQGSNPILGSGNGLFFANSPAISVNLLPVSKVYDGKVEVNLSASNYNVTGILAGDLVKIKPAVGAYDNKNAGTGKLVSVSGLTIADATESASKVAVFGYNLSSTEASGAIGTITPLPLSAAAIAPGSSIYGSALAPGAVSFGNIVGSDVVASSASVLTTTLSTSGKPIIGSYSQSASGLTGADAGNYSFLGGFTTATPNYTISKAPLTISAVTDSRVYDGTTSSSAAPTVTSGELFKGDILTGLRQVFDIKDVLGTNQSTLKVSTDYTLTDGNNGNNYAVSLATASGTITPLDLPVTGLVALDKVYDATTVAPLEGSKAAVSPLSGDQLTVGGKAAGAFGDKNVGIDKAVTVTGLTIAGKDAGNYNLLQQTGLVATISRKDLSVTGLFALDKIYDATTEAPLGGSAAVNPFSADMVTVSGKAIGTFADKNAAQAKVVSLSGLSLSGKDAGNYNLLPLTNLTAAVTPAPLQISASSDRKIYDGTSNSGLIPTIAVGSLWGDDRLTGLAQAFESKNALGTGQSKLIVSAYTLSDDNNGSNDALSFLSSPGTISRASVTPSFEIKNKPYDGNVAAEIAGNSLQGVLASDDVFIVGASAFFDNASTGNDKLVTITGYTLSGQAANNYQLSPPAATSRASITMQQDNRALMSNEEPIKIEEVNPAVGVQLSKLSSPTISKSDDIDISNVTQFPPVASPQEVTPSDSMQPQAPSSTTAMSATQAGSSQSQPTISATAVSSGSATNQYQESDQSSADDAKTSLGLSNLPTTEALSPTRLQLVMQDAASLIRKYSVRMLNP
ncbi:MAG: YDG domain-containing protein [Cyanobacteriota bacterium]